MTDYDVAIVGAGPAGVSVAVSLRDRGLRPLLIDRADQVASSWRSRYDRLKLNTGRPFSHLPNRRYPEARRRFPPATTSSSTSTGTPDEDGIELRLGTRVERIDRARARLARYHLDGRRRRPQVVVATGYQGVPVIPAFPGQLHRRDAALLGIPKRQARMRAARTRRRHRVVGYGDRPRPCHRRRRQGLWRCERRRTSCVAPFLVDCPAMSSRSRCTTYRHVWQIG